MRKLVGKKNKAPNTKGQPYLATMKFWHGPTPKKWWKFTQPRFLENIDDKRLLASVLHGRKSLFFVAVLLELIVYGSTVVFPTAIGMMLDANLARGLTWTLIPGATFFFGYLLARSVASVAELYRMIIWMNATLGMREKIVRTAVGLRAGGRQRFAAGEIVAAIISDCEKIGTLASTLPQLVASFLVLLVLLGLVFHISFYLGWVILLGLPLVFGLILATMKPLQKRLDAMREEKGDLTTLATDVVVGLRVLQGIGGQTVYQKNYRTQSEKMRDAGIKAAKIQALLSALNTVVPVIFTAVVVSLAFFEFHAHQITAGELVALYGYMLALSAPVFVCFSVAWSLADARVGANKIHRILQITPLTADDFAQNVKDEARIDTSTEVKWQEADLYDPLSQVTVQGRGLTALVSANPQVASEVAQRFARVDDNYEIRVQNAGSDYDLRQFPLALVRDNIVLSGAIAHLFQGSLRFNLSGRRADMPVARSIRQQVADAMRNLHSMSSEHEINLHGYSKTDLDAAMFVADAQDVVALGEGYEQYIEERGRSLSGGQRQRIALARAVLPDSPILVLIEPTSAVDSHTEERIVQRLRAVRLDKTTLVVATSPLILQECDQVVLLNEDGQAIACGTHQGLLANLQYRAIVQRDFAELPELNIDSENGQAQTEKNVDREGAH